MVDEAADVPGTARTSDLDLEGTQWRRCYNPHPEPVSQYYVGGLTCSAIEIFLSLILPGVRAAFPSRGPAESLFHPPPVFGSSS